MKRLVPYKFPILIFSVSKQKEFGVYLRICIIFFTLSLLACGKAFCQPFIWADSCSSISFFGKITSPGYSDFSQVHEYPGGDIIVAGTFKDNFAQLQIARNYGNIMRISRNGNLVWSRFIGIVNPSLQVDLRTYASVVTQNGDIVIIVSINAVTSGGNYILRFNSSGALLWQKKIPYDNAASPSDQYIDLIETIDDGLLISGSTVTKGLYMKLNLNGEYEWSTKLSSDDLNISITGITESPAAFYLTGIGTSVLTNYSGNYVVKADKILGDVVWAKWMALNAIAPLSENVEYELNKMHFKNGIVNMSGSSRIGYNGINNNAQVAVNFFESDLNLAVTRIENLEAEIDFANTYQGSLYDPFYKTGVQFDNASNSDYYVYTLNDNNLAKWSWKIAMPDIQVALDSKVFSDSSFVVAGLTRNTNSDIAANILKTSKSGKLESCSNQPFPFIVTTSTAVMQDIPNLQESHNSGNQTTTSTLDVFTGTGFSWQLNCSNVNNCKLSKILGAIIVCKDSVNFYINARSGNCSNAVIYSSNAPCSIIYNSDSSANIRFLAGGTYTLYASMQADCGILMDSMIIMVTQPAQSLWLGSDTSICINNKISIKAPGDFVSYLWQDNSMDSFLLVSNPGNYYLTVTDACGNIFSDTIRVNPAPLFEFSIGADRIKCNNDTVMLSASTGFYNYHWLPDYNLSNTSLSLVVANPLIDTVYTVVAELYPGCLAFDTIQVHVITSPEINLGVDKLLCESDKLQLNAGTGFSQYLWNTGEISSTINVNQTGSYTVTGIFSNGCITKDTIIVSERLCIDDIYFPAAFSPNNDGLNDIFQPIVYKALLAFHFEIYDRWGKKIFETSDVNKGWNGKVAGLVTGSTTFTWVCSYRFDDNKYRVKKGTIILIR